jgi:hypothetical protein
LMGAEKGHHLTKRARKQAVHNSSFILK